jgi:glycosyltransferase involved in cell wall biosynthesis
MKSIKKILFVSQLCSPHLIDYIFKTSIKNLGQAGPKFYRLLTEGLAMHNVSCKVETLSVIPVATESHSKRFWSISSEVVGNIHFNYVPMLNLPVLRNIIVIVYSFFKIILWSLLQAGNNKVIICDVLGLSHALPSIWASKLTGTKIIAIVTDLPVQMILDSQTGNRLKRKIYYKVMHHILCAFDGYLLLTEQMNKLVNPLNKPFIVMEGLVDVNMSLFHNTLEGKASKRILLYAGGIYEKYGIKKLIEAFMQLKDHDLQLNIYGSGEMEKDMPFYMNLDSRIIYGGVISNQMVVQKEIEATLLINPRSSKEEFTKYSFPSKNMEYMVSGTPIVTTPLPGMPQEYNPYVFLFNEESVNGFYLTLKSLLDKSDKELNEFGSASKKFVLDYKSNYKQAERILELVELL